MTPYPQLLKQCQEIAQETCGSIILTEDYKTASKDADVIATDVWTSVSKDKVLLKQRIKELMPYHIKLIMKKWKLQNQMLYFYIFYQVFMMVIHKLLKILLNNMVETGELEVTDELFRFSASKVFQQSENCLHTVKAVMLATLKG